MHETHDSSSWSGSQAITRGDRHSDFNDSILTKRCAKMLAHHVKPHAPAMTTIKEGTDYGFDQTHHTGSGRRRSGNGRSAARICSADGPGRSRQVLRKRLRS